MAEQQETSTSREHNPSANRIEPAGGSGNALESKPSASKGENRYEVTVLSLASLIFATFILQGLAKCNYQAIRLLMLPCAMFLAFFFYLWVLYFSDGLTRRKRAHFDVKNILETYQPNRNTDITRNFQPDPPTPDIASSASNQPPDAEIVPTTPASVPDEKKKHEFENWRRKHYDNEYGIAMQAMTANLDNPFELTDERADQAMEQPAVPHASGATQEATSSSADQGQKEQQQKKGKLEDPRTPEEEDYNKLRSAGTNVVLPGNMDGGPERVQLFTHCDPPSEKQQNTQKDKLAEPDTPQLEEAYRRAHYGMPRAE